MLCVIEGCGENPRSSGRVSVQLVGRPGEKPKVRNKQWIKKVGRGSVRSEAVSRGRRVFQNELEGKKREDGNWEAVAGTPRDEHGHVWI